MSLVSLVIVLIVIGVVLYLINTYIPMAQPYQDHHQRVGCSCGLPLAPRINWYPPLWPLSWFRLSAGLLRTQ